MRDGMQQDVRNASAPNLQLPITTASSATTTHRATETPRSINTVSRCVVFRSAQALALVCASRVLQDEEPGPYPVRCIRQAAVIDVHVVDLDGGLLVFVHRV